MKKYNLIFAIIATFVVSTSSFAYDRYSNSSRSGHHSSHGKYNSRQRDRSNHSRRSHHNKHSSYGYSNNRYNKHNSSGYYGKKSYNKHNSNGYYGKKSYNKHNYNGNRHNRHNGHYKQSKYSHYGNYDSYNYNNQYYYKPVRGIGHYYARDGYGYGHWHDAMWCADNHSNAYYRDYYSANPFSDGWRRGDGDYGISFYLNY